MIPNDILGFQQLPIAEQMGLWLGSLGIGSLVMFGSNVLYR